MKIDIAMSATLRPALLTRALTSLKNNLLFDGSMRLVLDIAEVGDATIKREKILQDATAVFGADNVLYRMRKNSSLPEVVRWGWQTAEGAYIIQWKDDWILRKECDLGRILKVMRKDRTIGQVFLDRRGDTTFTQVGPDDLYERTHLDFVTWKKEKKVSSAPSVLRRAYITEVAPLIEGDVSLYALSYLPQAQKVLSRWKKLIYMGYNNGGFVDNIGRDWIMRQNYQWTNRIDRGVLWLPKP